MTIKEIPGGIKNIEASLSADVAMITASVWYDGPTVTLSAGTWLVSGFITHQRTTAAAGNVYARIRAGTTDYASTQYYHAGVSNISSNLAMSAIITLNTDRLVKLQGSTNSGVASSYMKASIGYGNTATKITAIKLS